MIRAIETRYKGRRFRSRLEARWAVFFSKLGASWEYEPEGFELPSDRYLPDFWLIEFDSWVEIKGCYPSDHEIRLACELADATQCSVGIFHGDFVSANNGEFTANALLCMGIEQESSLPLVEKAEWVICSECFQIRIAPFGDPQFLRCKTYDGSLSVTEERTCGPNSRLSRVFFQLAYQAAIGARFEFGEEE